MIDVEVDDNSISIVSEHTLEGGFEVFFRSCGSDYHLPFMLCA